MRTYFSRTFPPPSRFLLQRAVTTPRGNSIPERGIKYFEKLRLMDGFAKHHYPRMVDNPKVAVPFTAYGRFGP